MEYSEREIAWIKRCVDDYLKTTKYKPIHSYDTELYLYESDGTFRYFVTTELDTERYFGYFEHDAVKDIITLRFNNINEEWDIKL